ncbi:MAG TPA: HYR domain-containing protein, partial [Actinomycetota bacterium]
AGLDTFRYVGSSSTGYLSLAIVTIDVRDTVPPVLTVPADITAEATSAAGAAVGFTPTATDNVPPPPSIVCSPASGSTFALGSTTVECTATDARGNTDSESFTVTVVDTTPPAISGMPAPIVAEATGPWGAPVSWVAPTASDLVSGSVAVDCSPASGSTFALGATDVLCTATDAAGNSSSATSSVTVRDTTAPSLSGVPGNLTREATGPAGAAVTWDAPTSLDLVDGSPAVTCSPASGTTFALGTTTVTCSASDTRGNSASQSFQVTVADTIAPAWDAEPADLTREATGPAGAVATWPAPTASDAVDASVAVACDRASGSTFALGSTTVACTATDDAGNVSATDFVVLVQDTTAPAITVPAPITVEADSAAGTVVTYAASATDVVDGSVAVTCSPASGSTFAVGATTVTCTATDAAGNTGSRSFTVTVRGPVALATDLCAYITTNNLGPGNSLKAKCAAARTAIVAGYTDDACSTLQALLNEVRAQRGKKLTLAQADRITAEATRIRTILGC